MDPASPELVALLAACRARPADDLPRLVLADWLDENGDPDRAEFVRVQVELSHPTADAKRTAELRGREAKLLKDHGVRWIGGYREVQAALGLPERDIATYRQHGRYPPDAFFARGTFWIGNAADMLDGGEFRRWLRSPEAAWLDQADLDLSSVDWFVKADLPDELHGRVGLTLRLMNVDAAAAKRLFRLLSLSSNFTSVRALTVTGVSGHVVANEITKADVSALVSLAIPGNETDMAVRLVATSPFTSLSSLDVGRIREVGLRAIVASPYLGNLTHLTLTASTIGDAGMAALCRSKLAATLRSVEFANTGIGDVGVTHLANSTLMGQMHGPRLNLMMNRIGGVGLRSLAQSEHLLRFRELVLRENEVTDLGIEALAASPYAANLQYLDFWRNRITDRGAFALARSPHLNSVVDLSVKENAVTAAGAAALHARFGEAAKV